MCPNSVSSRCSARPFTTPRKLKSSLTRSTGRLLTGEILNFILHCRRAKVDLLGSLSIHKLALVSELHLCDRKARKGIATKLSFASYLRMWTRFSTGNHSNLSYDLAWSSVSRVVLSTYCIQRCSYLPLRTTNNVEGVSPVLSRETAAPTDLRFDSGWTPVHFALETGSLDVCEFLLKQGARAHDESLHRPPQSTLRWPDCIVRLSTSGLMSVCGRCSRSAKRRDWLLRAP